MIVVHYENQEMDTGIIATAQSDLFWAYKPEFVCERTVLGNSIDAELSHFQMVPRASPSTTGLNVATAQWRLPG